MTKDAIVAALPGTRTEILRLLVKHRLTSVPVVRKDRSLAGVVTRHHIFSKPLKGQLAVVVDRRAHPFIRIPPFRDAGWPPTTT